MGKRAGNAVAALSVIYAVVLAVGLLTLPSPAYAIQDPWFTIMEVLILAIAPAMLAFTIALHSWVDPGQKAVALLGVVFMGLCAVVTCSVHFSVLTLSRHPAYAEAEWAPLVFAFNWPSVVYALDILAWDVFFPLAALSSALALRGAEHIRTGQCLLAVSSAFAFIGLLGVPLANMQIRNIGIIGYVLLFPCAAVLLGRRFARGRIAGPAGPGHE